ncbi:Fur family transcriptional regulator [[Clostridium] colinum]|uniref:Fur family transcriptional regulator n=1 Tax=[Clostridium] colinum TaxID=36835 RepID=UPI002023DBA0|nr:transcriptional repressor [[Clostridium] colinum]
MPRLPYNTKQKQIILDFLKLNSNKHITVFEIEEHLKEINLPVGVSTIYRNLEMFVKQGIVKKYAMEGNSSAYFEYIDNTKNSIEQFHFRCKDCGKLQHFESKELQTLTDIFKSNTPIKIDLEDTVFCGVCNKCHQNI